MHQGTKDMHHPKLIKEQLTLRSKKESKTQHDLIDYKCDALRDLVPFLQLKSVKNTHGVIFLVKMQASDCHFTKSSTPPWVFWKYLKLHKWY